METQVWTKLSDKSAEFLTLRGTEVHKLSLSSSKFFLKKNVAKVLDALVAGTPPAEAGTKVVHSIDARQIGQVELSPGNGILELKGEGGACPHVSFTSSDNKAHEIWDAIRAQSGRTYEPKQVEISTVDAVSPAILLGVVCAIPVGLIYYFAQQVASGEEIEMGHRRRGLQKMLLAVAEVLGTGGTIAIGVVLFLLLAGWAARRVIVRPLKTVWAPTSALA